MAFTPGAQECTVHQYTPRLIAIEQKHSVIDDSPQNLIIWVHGLGDGLLNVPYPSVLAKALPETWSLAQILLSSSYGCWGTSSVFLDAEDIAECVRYFRGIKHGKIVLMGHSTGCQDVMEYLAGPGHENRPAVEGAILQAPVSDREAMLTLMSKEQYDESVAAAQAQVAAGAPYEILPTSVTHGFFGAPVSALRWLSLSSPNHDGDEDYFSSDLSDSELKRRFGGLPAHTTMCFLYSGADEFVPHSVDKTSLVNKWMKLVRESGGKVDEVHSGVIEGATHNLRENSQPIVSDVIRRVVGFINNRPRSPALL